jgi:pimeloyl-ACP methyl ester carboxylesterase
MKTIRTSVLDICYEEGGSSSGPPILLLHGWPDGPRGWTSVAHVLEERGWRTIVPYLRGSSPTRFLSDQTPRDGSYLALTQDAIDLADALKLDRFCVVGHDWGARTAYTLAALFPDRISAVAGLSTSYQPGGKFSVPDLEQSRRYWYQWFQCTDGGADAVRKNPIAFARIQWDTWSPPGWFDEAEFAATSRYFNDPDWAAITLNSYRSRWIADEKTDPRYAPLRQKLSEIENVSPPTLMIHGQSDYCVDPKQFENSKAFFTGEYRRLVLDGVGHFPHREAPSLVAEAIVEFLSPHVGVQSDCTITSANPA